MSEENITRISLDQIGQGYFDKERVENMTEEEVMAIALADPDAQPTTEGFWEDATVYQPQASVHLDHDVFVWLQTKGYQPQQFINNLIHEQMRQNP